jgi:hypothetical protein
MVPRVVDRTPKSLHFSTTIAFRSRSDMGPAASDSMMVRVRKMIGLEGGLPGLNLVTMSSRRLLYACDKSSKTRGCGVGGNDSGIGMVVMLVLELLLELLLLLLLQLLFMLLLPLLDCVLLPLPSTSMSIAPSPLFSGTIRDRDDDSALAAARAAFSTAAAIAAVVAAGGSISRIGSALIAIDASTSSIRSRNRRISW